MMDMKKGIRLASVALVWLVECYALLDMYPFRSAGA